MRHGGSFSASPEEKPSDLTCVAKLTDRVIGRLNSARQLKPVDKERNEKQSCVSLFYSDVERLQPECFRLSSFRV